GQKQPGHSSLQSRLLDDVKRVPAFGGIVGEARVIMNIAPVPIGNLRERRGVQANAKIEVLARPIHGLNRDVQIHRSESPSQVMAGEVSLDQFTRQLEGFLHPILDHQGLAVSARVKGEILARAEEQGPLYKFMLLS